MALNLKFLSDALGSSLPNFEKIANDISDITLGQLVNSVSRLDAGDFGKLDDLLNAGDVSGIKSLLNIADGSTSQIADDVGEKLGAMFGSADDGKLAFRTLSEFSDLSIGQLLGGIEHVDKNKDEFLKIFNSIDINDEETHVGFKKLKETFLDGIPKDTPPPPTPQPSSATSTGAKGSAIPEARPPSGGGGVETPPSQRYLEYENNARDSRGGFSHNGKDYAVFEGQTYSRKGPGRKWKSTTQDVYDDVHQQYIKAERERGLQEDISNAFDIASTATGSGNGIGLMNFVKNHPYVAMSIAAGGGILAANLFDDDY